MTRSGATGPTDGWTETEKKEGEKVKIKNFSNRKNMLCKNNGVVGSSVVFQSVMKVDRKEPKITTGRRRIRK